MFKNNAEDEVDFCEAYKSQILNNDIEEKESPLGSILIILFLLAMIIALSIFGYNYITKNSSGIDSPISVKTIADDELKVTEEIVAPVQIKEVKEEIKSENIKKEDIKKNVTKSFNELPKSKSVDIDDLADKVKIDMSENEVKSDSTSKRTEEESKKIEEPLSPLTNSEKSTYIEDLAKLTEEIDKERD